MKKTSIKKSAVSKVSTRSPKPQKVIGSRVSPPKPQKVIGSKISAKDIITFNYPPLTAKQKKVLATPLKAGWEEPVLSAPTKRKMKKIIKKEIAKQQPKTLAKFDNTPAFTISVFQKSTSGSIEICKNKITKQFHYRIKGRNGEILCQSEPMHNRADVMSNLVVVKNILQ